MSKEIRQKANIHKQCTAFYVIQNKCNVALCFMLTSLGKGLEGILSQAEDLPWGVWKGRDVLSHTGVLKLIFSSFMYQIDV